MFNDRYGLTQAVLEGKKTMTRRLMTMTLHKKNRKKMNPVVPDDMFIASDGTAHFQVGRNGYMVPKKNQPAFHVGEEVAIAQNYKDAGLPPSFDCLGAFQPTAENHAGWKNKMFVAAEHMPHRIIIRKVDVQRLQSISDEDCLKEGVEKWIDCYIVSDIMENYGKNNVCFDTPREAFAALIDRISGKGTWQRNPWVYVYEFELLK